MSLFTPSPEENAEDYARRYGDELKDRLGGGVNGSVWINSKYNAIKAFEREDAYQRERDALLRLSDLGVEVINEFYVPRIIRYDDELLIVEMTVVQPPFILDFAGSYLDGQPDYPPEALAERERRNAKLFGEKWPRVRIALSKLREWGIFYVDLNRGNVRFPEYDEPGSDETGELSSSPPPPGELVSPVFE